MAIARLHDWRYPGDSPSSVFTKLHATWQPLHFLSVQLVGTRLKTSPEKYEPAYGGWCAYAMGETGEKVKIDPETYKIVDGKLFLFYNFWGNNTLEDWNENEKSLKSKADQNWKKIVP